MTSSNGNSFHVTGLLCGEFTGDRWIPLTKASDAGLGCFRWSAPWINGWVNYHEAGDLRSHPAHDDVIVMKCTKNLCHSCLWLRTSPFQYDHEVKYDNMEQNEILCFNPWFWMTWICSTQFILNMWHIKMELTAIFLSYQLKKIHTVRNIVYMISACELVIINFPVFKICGISYTLIQNNGEPLKFPMST